MLKNETYDLGKVASMYNIKDFLTFRVTLRNKLLLDNDLTQVKLLLKSSIFDCKKRNVVFCSTIKNVDNQIVPPSHKTPFVVYDLKSKTCSYDISYLEIMVEYFSSEKNKILKSLETENNKIHSILIELLEFFTYKYNMSVSGNDFLEIEDCCSGALVCEVYQHNNLEKRFDLVGLIANPSFSFDRKVVNEVYDFKKVMNSDFIMWKYLYNKATYMYSIENNRECVLNAAMAIESYLIQCIKDFNQYEDYKIKYNSKLGAISAINYLKQYNILSKKELSLIKNNYKKIRDIRVLIVHGVIESPYLDRVHAEVAYKCLTDALESAEKKLLKDTDFNMPSKSFEQEYFEFTKILEKFQNQEYHSVISDLNQKIKENVFTDICYYNRAICNYFLGNSRAAIEDFKKSVKNSYMVVSSYRLMGSEQFKLGLYEEAIKSYSKILEIDGKDKNALFNRSQIYYCLKKYEKAINDLNMLIILDPDFTNYKSRGVMYYHLEQNEKALSDFNKSIELYDDDFENYFFRCQINYEKNDISGVKEDALKCLKTVKDQEQYEATKNMLLTLIYMAIYEQKVLIAQDLLNFFENNFKV